MIRRSKKSTEWRKNKSKNSTNFSYSTNSKDRQLRKTTLIRSNYNKQGSANWAK